MSVREEQRIDIAEKVFLPGGSLLDSQSAKMYFYPCRD